MCRFAIYRREKRIFFVALFLLSLTHEKRLLNFSPTFGNRQYKLFDPFYRNHYEKTAVLYNTYSYCKAPTRMNQSTKVTFSMAIVKMITLIPTLVFMSLHPNLEFVKSHLNYGNHIKFYVSVAEVNSR